jgi:hypothetical protein
MNVHLAIHMKGFVISPVMGEMIVITLLCAATLFFFFVQNLSCILTDGLFLGTVISINIIHLYNFANDSVLSF